jgi:hypothetical protein
LRVKALLLCLAIFAGLSCRQKTEEDVVLEVIDSLTHLAEHRNLEGMMACFAEVFVDFEGRDKEELRSLLSSYFGRRSGIVVHALSRRVIRFDDGHAEVEADVALSSGGGEALRRLVRISPDIYRTRAELIKNEDEWRISYAEWSEISLADLLPESMSVLKKLFPKI